MKILNSIESFNIYRTQLKTNNIGFVATMGALHQGHLSLVNRSLTDNKNTIVSIFINPTQFDKANDLDNYPNLLFSFVFKRFFHRNSLAWNAYPIDTGRSQGA